MREQVSALTGWRGALRAITPNGIDYAVVIARQKNNAPHGRRRAENDTNPPGSRNTRITAACFPVGSGNRPIPMGVKIMTGNAHHA